MNGVNPKSWFYGLRDALAANDSHAILAGAACEQWLNAELFRVIGRSLNGTRLTAYPEWSGEGRRHDVAVLPFVPGEPDAWRRPVAIVECKLVYRSYGPEKRADYLERLVEQLDVAFAHEPLRVGFFLAVYAAWPDYRQPASFSEFRSDVGALFRERMRRDDGGLNLRTDHGESLETLVPETTTKIGAADVIVGCVGQYFRVERR